MSSRHIRMARKIAAGSPYRSFPMAALLLRGGAVVAAESNGKPPQGKPNGRGHAEARVLRPHLDARGTHLIVLRLNGNQSSRPCPHCVPKIRAAGVDRVSFVDVDGVWKTLSAGEL